MAAHTKKSGKASPRKRRSDSEDASSIGRIKGGLKLKRRSASVTIDDNGAAVAPIVSEETTMDEFVICASGEDDHAASLLLALQNSGKVELQSEQVWVFQ